MLQILAFVLEAILLVAVKSDYDWSYSPYGGDLDQNECVFKGEVDNTDSNLCKHQEIVRYDFKQDEDLTWSRLVSACPELVYAGCADSSWGSDKSMADLEWYSCGQCPKCPCNKNQPDNYYIKNYTQFGSPFEVSVCYECNCDDWYQTSSESWVYAFDCHQERYFNDPDELKDIQCPYTTPAPTPAPTGGCDDGTDATYNPGDYYFKYDADQCETYCQCNSTNGGDCETGWANIMANDQLKYRFLETCHDKLKDAWDDTDRWVTPEAATYCFPNYMSSYYRCPSVNCGAYADGATWSGLQWSYGVYDDDGNFEKAMYDCVDCDCSGTTVSCDSYDDEEAAEEDCSRDTLLCAYDATNDGDVGDTLDFTQCDVGDGESYCGWIEAQAVDGFNPDKVCAVNKVELSPYWGCQQASFCEGFFGKAALEASTSGICSYTTVSFEAATYDCINYMWVEETYTLNYNFMCCSGTRCNDQEPSSTALGDSNACSSNSKMSSYLQVQQECQIGGRKRFNDNNDFAKYVMCGKSLPEGQYTVCSLLAPYWRYNTYCDCRGKQMLEKMYPVDDYHNGLRDALQLQFDNSWENTKAMLEVWNEAYSCGETFECDITQDIAIDDIDTTQSTEAITTTGGEITAAQSTTNGLDSGTIYFRYSGSMMFIGAVTTAYILQCI